MMAAHEVSDAELAEDEREPYFDADPQAYYAARAEEEAKRRERVARAAEEYERANKHAAHAASTGPLPSSSRVYSSSFSPACSPPFMSRKASGGLKPF